MPAHTPRAESMTTPEERTRRRHMAVIAILLPVTLVLAYLALTSL